MKLTKVELKDRLSMIAMSFLSVIFIVSCSQNQSKDVTTEHGYRLEMLRDQPGETAKTDEVFIYNMKVFADDSLIVNTHERDNPLDFRWMPEEKLATINNPIVDAFQILTSGDSARVYMPADSLKGNNFGLASGEFLIYELSIHNILTPAQHDSLTQIYQAELDAKRAVLAKEAEGIAETVATDIENYKAGALKGRLIKDETGLEYIVHEEGDGALPTTGEVVNVHYYGVLLEDGTMFDNSYGRGNPFSFPLGRGQVIPGWDRGISLLKKGSKATLFIPYMMAYGATGSPPTIPAKANLVFYVELLD